jgi:prophage maintenance system killer protein
VQTNNNFAAERNESFKGILQGIYQSFGGKDVYGSVQAKAAHLLYFIVKDHPFYDGNKRSAAALFVYFLDKSGLLYDAQHRPLVENNTLAAITLMIALSKPEEKDQMILLVMNFLERSGDGKN